MALPLSLSLFSFISMDNHKLDKQDAMFTIPVQICYCNGINIANQIKSYDLKKVVKITRTFPLFILLLYK